MKITKAQRKLLTEWLGECWHENVLDRTFDKWQDFGAVVEKLNQVKKDDTFYWLLIWLLQSPQRFCALVAEAIEEGEIK
jgi:hypothetical protein